MKLTVNAPINSLSFGNVSVMNAALTRNPTFFMAWPGLEDVFQFARNGGRGLSLLTASDFSLYLDSLIAPLAFIVAITGN